MDKKTKLFDIVAKKFGKLIDKISDTNISKEENEMEGNEVKKEAAPAPSEEPKVEVVAAAKLPETTKELAEDDRVYDAEAKKVDKEVKKVETTKDLSELNKETKIAEKTELKTVLDKLSAYEYNLLIESLQKKSEEKSVEVKAEEPKVEEVIAPVVTEAKEEIAATAEKKEEVKELTFPENPSIKQEAPKAEGDNELKKLTKDILSRCKAELDSTIASRLYKHNFLKILANAVSSTFKEEDKAKQAFDELVKESSLAIEAGKDYYYYFTGAKSPKPVDLPFKLDDNRDSEGAGKDVTKVEKGTQTPDQVIDKGDKKDEHTSATEKVRSEQEKANTIDSTKKKMHFAEFNKGEKLSKESFWTVKDQEGNLVIKASLDNIWQDQVDKEASKFEDETFVTKYKESLENRIDTDGVEKVAELLGTTVITAKKKAAKESEVLKLIEEIEDALHIQESKEHDEKEKELPFIDHVLEEMQELHKHLVKKEAPKAEDKPAKKEDKKEEKEFSGTPVESAPAEVAAVEPATIIEQPVVDVAITSEKKENSEIKTEASIFDKQEVLLGEGVMAVKDKESKMITVKDKDGKELGKYPDGFGDDTATVIQLLREVLKLDKKKDKEEKKEDKKEEKYSSDTKSEKEIQLEAELMKLRTEAAIKEKTARCRSLIEEMLEKGLINPDDSVIEASQKEGKNVFDAKKAGIMKAVDEQMTELFKMDKFAFDAFERSIRKIQKKASMKEDVLKKAPNFVKDPSSFYGQSDIEWLQNLPWS